MIDGDLLQQRGRVGVRLRLAQRCVFNQDTYYLLLATLLYSVVRGWVFRVKVWGEVEGSLALCLTVIPNTYSLQLVIQCCKGLGVPC